MINKPLISVIMNCYNGEKYLSQSIESVINQTYKNWELIFWDNRSKDQSSKILKSFNDKRLKYYLAEEHSLLYKARNLAIEKCKGEFISFLDVDDWWDPNKLQLQIKKFSDESVGLVFSKYWFVNQRKKLNKKISSKSKHPTGKVTKYLFSDFFAAFLTVMIRKKYLSNLEYIFDNRFHIIGDYDLVIRLSVVSNFDYVDLPLAYYRWHDKNETSKHLTLHHRELENWYIDMKKNIQISKYKELNYIKIKFNYLKGMDFALNNKKLNVLKLFIYFPFTFEKFKLFLLLILPKSIIRKIRT